MVIPPTICNDLRYMSFRDDGTIMQPDRSYLVDIPKDIIFSARILHYMSVTINRSYSCLFIVTRESV